MNVPHELIVRGIRDLNARQQNAGCWPNGIPQSFTTLREQLGFNHDTFDSSWVLCIEQWLCWQAVRLVAEGTPDV